VKQQAYFASTLRPETPSSEICIPETISRAEQQRQSVRRLSTPSPKKLSQSYSTSDVQSLGSKVQRAQKLVGVELSSIGTVLGALCEKVEQQQELLDHFNLLTNAKKKKTGGQGHSLSSQKSTVSDRNSQRSSVIRYPKSHFGQTPKTRPGPAARGPKSRKGSNVS